MEKKNKPKRNKYRKLMKKITSSRKLKTLRYLSSLRKLIKL